MNTIRRQVLVAAVGLFLIQSAHGAQTLNGFEIDPRSALIPLDEIHSGGPPRDGIPSIDEPRFAQTDEMQSVDGAAPVLGLFHNGVAKAYPIAIMNWHEIVNDLFGGDPVVVTYCPLCGSGVAFSASIDGRDVTFGVSGLLYNSDVLLFDRETESLWSQIHSKAVTGKMTGTGLGMLPLIATDWKTWRKEYPTTLLLSRDTGVERDYDRDPYAGYESSEGVWFPVNKKDPRYHPKERVLGIEVNGALKAYPFAELSKTSGDVRDEFNGRTLRILYDEKSGTGRAFGPDGKDHPVIRSFWFAWYAFHPATEVYIH